MIVELGVFQRFDSSPIYINQLSMRSAARASLFIQIENVFSVFFTKHFVIFQDETNEVLNNKG